MAAIVVCCLGSAAVLVRFAEQARAQAARDAQIASLLATLGESCESMLSAGDFTAVRRLLIDTRRNYELASCRIELIDGRVIADAEPSKITLVQPPATWPDNNAEAASADATPGVISREMALSVRGRGPARLRLCGLAGAPAELSASTFTGFSLLGLTALAALGAVYRAMRRRLVALSLLRDALLTAGRGVRSLDAFTLHPEFGPEAVAWNQLLAEIQLSKRQRSDERLAEAFGDRRDTRSGGSELAQACDALSIGMLVIDSAALVRHANGAAAALLRAKRDEILGQRVVQLINDPAIDAAVASLQSGTASRKSIELRRLPEQGGGILRVQIRPLRREDSSAALITVEDVTQQRIADEARNSFVAQATHELRTPLTNMRLCLEDALDESTSDPQTLRNHFNVLNQETRRLERMVGEMLSVAEIEAGSLRLKQDDVRLDKILEELAADYRPQASEKNLELKFDLPPKYPVLLGDRDKLMVTLHNLLGNALKYTPAGGCVTLAVRDTASTLTVEVSDTGIGINADEQQKVFEKFYRAKDVRVEKITGTGLGLALAREIARLHGGEISVQSELNKGSVFTLTLPLQTTGATAAKAA